MTLLNSMGNEMVIIPSSYLRHFFRPILSFYKIPRLEIIIMQPRHVLPAY